MPRMSDADYRASVTQLLLDGRPRTWREIADELRVSQFELLRATAEWPRGTPRPRRSREATRAGPDGPEPVPRLAVSLGVLAVRCAAVAALAGYDVALADLASRLDCSEASARTALRAARKAGAIRYTDVRGRVAIKVRPEWRKVMQRKRASGRDETAAIILEALEASGERVGARSEVLGRTDSSRWVSWLERHALITVHDRPSLIQIRAA